MVTFPLSGETAAAPAERAYSTFCDSEVALPAGMRIRSNAVTTICHGLQGLSLQFVKNRVTVARGRELR